MRLMPAPARGTPGQTPPGAGLEPAYRKNDQGRPGLPLGGGVHTIGRRETPC